jgi:hypothetical protein
LSFYSFAWNKLFRVCVHFANICTSGVGFCTVMVTI